MRVKRHLPGTMQHDRLSRADRAKKIGNWVVFVTAALVSVFGILLLWGVWRPEQVAAAFTRVGGATRVETALEVSRFWIAPRHVVTTEASADQSVMMEAARCAVAYDAPLLFNSPDRARRRLVIAAINSWETKAPKNSNVPFWIKVPAKGPLPRSCTARREPAKGKNIGDGRLSALQVPGQPRRLPYTVPDIPAQPNLAQLVIFAAAKAPGDPPDIAVGLALAAHLATADREQVSLVVVPRYLEADPGLENQLRDQHTLVKSGVVLGQPPVIPDDTNALLRQILIATDRQGVFSQIQANLGTVGPLVAALFALLGFTTAARVTPEIAPAVATGASKAGRASGKVVKQSTEILARIRRDHPMPTQAAGTALLKGLYPPETNITVWLRSGWSITGDRKDDATPSPVLRLTNPSLAKLGQDIPSSEPGAQAILVPVEDIELIVVNRPN